jgi:hypothetical protein
MFGGSHRLRRGQRTVTTRTYVKPPELLEEWEGLGSPEEPGFYNHLERASIETVVTACRVYGRVHGDRIYEVLIERVTPRIHAVIWRILRGKDHELTGFDREEVEGALADAFWRQVMRGESFFEIRFNKALLTRARSVYRDVVEGQQRTRERTALRLTDTSADEPLEAWAIDEVRLPPSTEDETDDADGRILAEALLAQLPAQHALALAVHLLMDLQIYSKDPTKHTVASVVRCSERQAHQLVAEGKELLRHIIHHEAADE